MDPFAFNHTPITKAVDYLPEFWKKINPYVSNKDETGPSIKYCRAFNSLYKESIMIPSWGCVTFQLQDIETQTFHWDTSFIASTSPQEVMIHSRKQFEGFADNYQHAKIMSPWSLKTNRFVNFLMSDPVWNRNSLSDYHVLPGVLDFKFQHGAHVNIMMEYRKEPRAFEIPANSPLALITPLTDESIEVKCHLVDYNDFIKNIPEQFISSKLDPHKKYVKNKAILEKMEEQKKAKCPFGFGK